VAAQARPAWRRAVLGGRGCFARGRACEAGRTGARAAGRAPLPARLLAAASRLSVALLIVCNPWCNHRTTHSNMSYWLHKTAGIRQGVHSGFKSQKAFQQRCFGPLVQALCAAAITRGNSSPTRFTCKTGHKLVTNCKRKSQTRCWAAAWRHRGAAPAAPPPFAACCPLTVSAHTLAHSDRQYPRDRYDSLNTTPPGSLRTLSGPRPGAPGESRLPRRSEVTTREQGRLMRVTGFSA
jgi:hypothetical protein